VRHGDGGDDDGDDGAPHAAVDYSSLYCSHY